MEKLSLSNGKLLSDPSLLDVGWKAEVHCLPDLCFVDIFNYLINTQNDCTKENLKAYKSLETYNFFAVGMSTMYYIIRLNQIPNFVLSRLR